MAINWTNNGTNNKWSENTTAIFEATGDLPSWVTSGQIDGNAYYVTSDGTTTKATGTNDGAVYSNGKLTITVNINMDINDWTVQVFGTNSSNVLRWPGFGAVSDSWADPGCQADDAESGDLTHRIIRTYEQQQSDGSWSAVDKINRSIEGTYRITYNVSDGRLSAEPVTRTVTLPKYIATPAALKGCGFTPASIEMLDDGQPRYRLVKRSEADDGEGWTMSGAIEHAESLGGSVACASTAEKHNQLALAYLSEFDKFVDTVDRDTRFWLGAPWNSNLGRYQWIDGLDPQFTYGYSIDASQDPDSSAFDDAGYTLGRYPCAVLDDVSYDPWGKLGYILDRVPLDPTQEAGNWASGKPSARNGRVGEAGNNFMYVQSDQHWNHTTGDQTMGYYLQMPCATSWMPAHSSMEITHVSGTFTWEEARLDALERGGQLAAIRYTSQQQLISGLNQSGWLGGVRVQFRQGSRSDGDIDAGSIAGRKYWYWTHSTTPASIVETSRMTPRSQLIHIKTSGHVSGTVQDSVPEYSPCCLPSSAAFATTGYSFKPGYATRKFGGHGGSVHVFGAFPNGGEGIDYTNLWAIDYKGVWRHLPSQLNMRYGSYGVPQVNIGIIMGKSKAKNNSYEQRVAAFSTGIFITQGAVSRWNSYSGPKGWDGYVYVGGKDGQQIAIRPTDTQIQTVSQIKMCTD